MHDHLAQASHPRAGAPVLGRAVHLPVLAPLLVLPDPAQLVMFRASVHPVLARHKHVLRHAVRKALDKGALLENVVSTRRTRGPGAGGDVGVARAADNVTVAARVDGRRAGVVEADGALEHLEDTAHLLVVFGGGCHRNHVTACRLYTLIGNFAGLTTATSPNRLITGITVQGSPNLLCGRAHSRNAAARVRPAAGGLPL